MREVRYVSVFLVGVSGLLLFAAVAPAQPTPFEGIDPAYDRCLTNCFGLEDQEHFAACAIQCNNAAAMRPGDDEVTLSSEEYVERWGDGVITTAGACHSTTPCPPEYGSCAGWSSFSDCGTPVCSGFTYCCELGPSGGPSMPICPREPALRQYREHYQVCFNAAGQSCTQYARTSIVLGCLC